MPVRRVEVDLASDRPFLRLLASPRRVTSTLRLLSFWMQSYFAAQRRHQNTSCTVVETAADARVTPREQAVYPYLFACVFVSYAAWRLLDRLAPSAYRSSMAAFRELIGTAQQVFDAHPTRMRDRRRSEHPLMLYTQQVDGPTNCFPSLHVAIVTLAYQILQAQGALSPELAAAMRNSCIDICRSTMETKQHSFVDVVGGLELARRLYEKHFGEGYQDLSPAILGELDAAEQEALRSVCARHDDLASLLPPLLATVQGFG